MPSRVIGLLALLLGVLLLPGCGGEEVVKLEDYLEELEFDRPHKSDKEIEVNSYSLPCAARHHDAAGRELPAVWVQIQFKLSAIAADEDEKTVMENIERHRGMIDDTVLAICRRCSIDDLEDSSLNTLKTNLLVALRPLLGEERVRQLILTPFTWKLI